MSARVGVPFAERRVSGEKCSVICPGCKLEIRLSKKKDAESWLNTEYAEHWAKEHSPQA
jgi:hypothetical protein